MNSIRYYKNHFTAVIVFFFLFSANALSYGVHLVEELGHDCTATTKQSCKVDTSNSKSVATTNFQRDSDKETQPENDETCCDSHAHAVIRSPLTCYKQVQFIISHLIVEPFQVFPDVHLDKFKPPQKLV